MFIGLKKNQFSKKFISEFIDHFARGDNWHEIDKTKGDMGYGWIHYGLIRNLKPERILVIGSRYGFIPAVCALACKDNKKGTVDFVDAGYDQANPEHNKKLGAKKSIHWGGVGFWKQVKPEKHFSKFGLEKYIKIYIMTSNEFSKKYPVRKWAYIYLDGDHSYGGVKKDFKRFWPKLEKGGYLLLHDIYTKNLGGLNYGVSSFWQELEKFKEHNLIEFPGKYGLGIIQKW